MKMPFDTLITDREPLVFLEKSKISVSSNHVISVDKEGSFNVPISSVHCLMLGNGTSITSDATALCAKHNCYVSFVKGGLNAHSIWHCGRYSNPKNLVKQVNSEVWIGQLTKRVSEKIDSVLISDNTSKSIVAYLGSTISVCKFYSVNNGNKSEINFFEIYRKKSLTF